MLAICDGGATKADWLIRDDAGNTASITTTGFNPNYGTAEQIATILQSGLAEQLPALLPHTIYYYGAGCGETDRKELLKDVLQGVFPKSHVVVNDDMLGAARATCGRQPGIACILGTGSNSMLYDGENVIDKVANLGFLLGDEGSGAYIGKKLVQAYFYREMPPELCPIMQEALPNGRKDLLDRVYHSEGLPSAYLASFVELFSGQFGHPFVRRLFKDCFTEFLLRHVCKYENHRALPVHFTGSVAYHCRDILQETIGELGLLLGRIVHKPALELLKYHVEDPLNTKSPT